MNGGMKCILPSTLSLLALASSCVSLRSPEASPDQVFLRALAEEERGRFAEAAELYHRAAQAGHAPAMNNLGLLHFEGRGVSKSYLEAACWYSESAQLGFAKAQTNLAVMKYFGLGTQHDEAQAELLLLMASIQGNSSADYALAMFNLGNEADEIAASVSAEQAMRATIID